MNDHKIEKAIRSVSFLLSDQSKIEGYVFLSLHDLAHSGPQNLGDLLNGDEEFIPIKTEKGIELINLNHLIQARIDPEEELDEVMKMGSSYTICAQLSVGAPVEGDVYISLQDGRFGRVKDYANLPFTFLRFFQPKCVIYVNQRYIISLHD
ncbi:MAG: hypothetical protein GXO96_08470 [Nitrospirae bacterium]|nr:hypothetical protein [Candidatus Manganitrophaceae bacterium]